jgi:DNA-binding MarR family transcriptional regulator
MATPKTKRTTNRREKTAPAAGAFGLGIENLIGYNLRRAHGVQKRRFTSVFEQVGIRPVTLSLLGTVFDHPAITQTELGKRLNIKRANMVPLLAELSARGLILRRPCDSDRRAQRVTLTAAGRKLTAKLLEMHRRLEDDLVRALGVRDSQLLVQLLKKFRELSSEPELTDLD